MAEKEKNLRTRYVCGLLFNGTGSVALIRKKRPDFMVGKLNGVGGHVESGESIKQAMIREFMEETGATVHHWRKFATVRSARNTKDGYEVFWFVAKQEEVVLRSMTDEQVMWVPVHVACNPALFHTYLPNVPWLVNMARFIEHDFADSFFIQEKDAEPTQAKAASAV